jgi:hypothetical protein
MKGRSLQDRMNSEGFSDRQIEEARNYLGCDTLEETLAEANRRIAERNKQWDAMKAAEAAAKETPEEEETDDDDDADDADTDD